jgi:hypothetical protein
VGPLAQPPLGTLRIRQSCPEKHWQSLQWAFLDPGSASVPSRIRKLLRKIEINRGMASNEPTITCIENFLTYLRASGLSSDELDQSLLESFRAGDCATFVGAGFSAPVGMPMWSGLLEQLVRRLRSSSRASDTKHALLAYAKKCIANGQLARAASAVRRSDPSGLIEQHLKDLFDAQRCFRDLPEKDPRRQEMQARLDALLSLPWAGVVTHQLRHAHSRLENVAQSLS